jgi:hypothetical protein
MWAAAVAFLLGLAGQSPDEVVSSGASTRLLVVPDPARPDDAERVAAALRARGLVPLPPHARRGVDGVVVDVARGDRERVRSLLGASRAAARSLDLDAAATSVAAALDEASRLERPEDQRELIVDVLLHDAALRLGTDKQDPAARASLRLASRLEPERMVLDPALHPPSLVAAFAQARDDNAAARSALVVVDPRVVGVEAKGVVEVVVDGVVVEVRERLLSLALGPHLLTLRAPGCQPSSRVVDVTADVAPLQPTLQPTGASSARAAAVRALHAANGADAAAAFARLAMLTGADVVVALDGVARVWRQDVGVRAVEGDVTEIAAFAAAIERALRPAPTVTPTPARRPPPPSSAELKAATIATDAGGGPDDGAGTNVLVVGGVVAGVVAGVVLGGIVVAGVVALWPGDAPPAPPRPVVVTAVVP